MRDYGNEQIFGGDKDCEHDFIIEEKLADSSPIVRWQHEQGGYGKNRFQKKINPREAVKEEKIFKKVKIGFCSKCQAWKGQLGLEPTPELYIEHMTEIFNEVKRVLKKEGTLWLNIGDTYWGGKGKSGYELPHEAEERRGKGETIQHSYNVPGYMEMRPSDGTHEFIKPKCLCMIPERLAWSLIQNGWILRNKIIWYKPNAMPSSVRDRFSNRWEYIFMFSKNKKYYFDLDAVREPHAESGIERMKYPVSDWRGASGDSSWCQTKDNPKKAILEYNPLGKNPGDVFEINTQPFPEAHFAVFPEKLCIKPIKAGCPEEVCKKCGKARERIVEQKRGEAEGSLSVTKEQGNPHKGGSAYHPIIESKTIGWTSCDCNAGFEGGIVLDPFCGAGTTLYVAKQLRRRYIGIDVKQEYCDMCEKRLAQGVL